jgi:hypothetical protein
MNHITVVAHSAPGSFVRNVQESPQIAVDLLNEAKAVIKAIPDPLHPLRVRLQAAVDLSQSGHIPRRPLPDLLAREAEVVGAALDAESLEHGEVAL